MKKSIKYILLAIFIILVIFYLFFVYERYKFNDRIYNSLDNFNKNVDYIIVFGAGLKSGDQPSDILADRLNVAVNLYKQGVSKKILMSGDGSSDAHNEVEVMFKYAVNKGVNSNDIIVDNEGYDTYSTCLHAKKVFNINNAILVTQAYHINRALYVCNELGIDSYGFTSDLNRYIDINRFKFRENFAFLKSFFEVKFEKWEKRRIMVKYIECLLVL